MYLLQKVLSYVNYSAGKVLQSYCLPYKSIVQWNLIVFVGDALIHDFIRQWEEWFVLVIEFFFEAIFPRG